MNTHADKTQENKSQSIANSVALKKSSGNSTFQFVDNRPEAIAQRKLQEIANNSLQAKQATQLQAMANNYSAQQQQQPIQKKENNTGLPDNLKTGIENLSGYSMDDVKVHYNSDKPAQLQAHAFAQGTDIHLASGQEKHLPHEAWHVVQQKQGRVKPTMQMKGVVTINDNKGLEKEADVMGSKAISHSINNKHVNTATAIALNTNIIQRKITVDNENYGMQLSNLDELATLLQLDGTLIEKKLKEKGISIDQILTRFDFQNKSFNNKREVIAAINKEIKKDINDDDKEIDGLVSVHPLATDNSHVQSQVLEFLKKKDPKGNIKNLIFEDTGAAKEVMALYKKNTSHPDSDTILFKSILATIELQNSGAIYREEFTEEEEELLTYATRAYNENIVEKMIQDYGLDEMEHNAIKAYSLPNKGEIYVGGSWNHYYMGYSKKNWGKYNNGWNALSKALEKLPSLGKLRLDLTTYRTSRDSTESDKLEQMSVGSQVLHGKNILVQEQQHVISTALTYNVHNTPDRIQKAKGLMAISGTSGVLINPFGAQGFLDGAEILFPPNMYSKLEKKVQTGYTYKNFSAPVYHLKELPDSKINHSQQVFDDFKFEQVKNNYQETQVRRSEKIKALIDQIQRFNQIINRQQINLGIEKQTIEKLTEIKEQLFATIEADFDNPKFIENYQKLVLIDKIKALPFEKRTKIEVYNFHNKPLWDHTINELEKYADL